MKQYQEAKQTAHGALLLFRMGDFYEMFYDDAVSAAETLGITVTSRDRKKGVDATPMAGFPYHQLDSYLAKLIAAGYKVAVCEQVEDPKKAKKIVKREVVRIVTPGTILDESILDPRVSNYLAALVVEDKKGLGPSRVRDLVAGEGGEKSEVASETLVGLSWVELSTGAFYAAVMPWGRLADQLGRIAPSEILLPENQKGILPSWLTDKCMITLRPDWNFNRTTAKMSLQKHFQVQTLEGFGVRDQEDGPAIAAAGALLDYLHETQKQSLAHLDTLVPWRCGGQMEIDESARRSLELVQAGRDSLRDRSLLGVLDRCVTAMGSRLLTQWLLYPLTRIEEITGRQDAIAEFLGAERDMERLRDSLRRVFDLERVVAKVVGHRATPRDLVAVARTLALLPVFKRFLDKAKSPLLAALGQTIDPLPDLSEQLGKAFVLEPPLNYREGNFIQNGYNASLDEYRQLQRGGKEWLLKYQAKEIERTGITNLKVGFTSVFGYYLEVTRSNSDRIPANYVRKQTLKNAERYITEELKEYEEKVLTAQDKAIAIELELFEQLQSMVVAKRAQLQRTASALAKLDVLMCLASIASTRGYVRPIMTAEPILEIYEGRHPVLDAMEEAGTFVANDSVCNRDAGTIHLITGPNMAGKSTFIRQVALLVVMSQMGSFIPAGRAKVGVVDRVFARVGAADELTRGQSTFMVEMIETARILNGATSQSLVILDEIGRGTSTYDGISLAWSIVEYLHENVGCRTFFATHYHELTDLAETYEGITNLNVAVREWNEEIAFLHKILPGAADKSYGIHVARLAGVPKPVVTRARVILDELEQSHVKRVQDAVRGVLQNSSYEHVSASGSASDRKLKPRPSAPVQFSLFGPEDHPVVDELKDLDPSHMTPMDALGKIIEWKESLKQQKSRKKS